MAVSLDDLKAKASGMAAALKQMSAREREQPPTGQLGVAPVDAWTCPNTHPIKGNFTTYTGERCIYHIPGGSYYQKTKPERCYLTEEEAKQGGCRRSKR